MPSDTAKHQALDELLHSLFVDAAEFHAFLTRTLGRPVIDGLPAKRVSLDEYLGEAVVKLGSRGLIDRAFFKTLAQAHPRSLQAIREVAQAYAVEPPERPVESPRLRARTTALRTQLARSALAGSRLPLPTRSPPPVRDANPNANVLRSGKLPPARTDNPASLLNARYTAVPFHTWLRADELATLQAWCDADDPAAVLVLVGPGGVGKTRLVLELCDRVRADGFVVGFVPQQATREELDRLVDFDGKALAIVDYAETRSGLAGWLERAAASTPGASQRLRVVLVVRALADWWDSLLAHSSSELNALLRRDRPLCLNPEALPFAARARIYAEAAAHFAALRGAPAPTTEPPPLAEPRFGKVLYLHMAALAAVEHRPTPIETLLADTLRRERQFWSMHLAGRDDEEARRTWRSLDIGVAAVILAGGACTHSHALGLLTRAGVGEPLREPLLTRLGDLYPGTGDGTTYHAHISPLEPDLLAEAHVIDVLLHRATPPALVAGLFAGAEPAAVLPALALLGRLASSDADERTAAPREGLDHALRTALRGLLAEDLAGRAPVALAVAVTLAERHLRCPLAEVLAEALHRDGTPGLAETLAEHPFSRAIALHRIEEWIYRTLLDACPEADRRRRFTSLIRLGGVKMAQGQRDAARQLMAEAVSVAHTWIDEDPAALWPSLMGFGLLGLTTGEVGEHEQAVATARETLRMCDLLEQDAPGEHEELVLLIHMMYGLALFRSGARGEAINVFTAMQARYERLAAEDALPERALCDFYLGICLNETGHHQTAASALVRAVAIQRELVAQQRGSHLEALAWTLIYLCEAVGRLGAHTDALRIGDEAVTLWESLATLNGEAARPGLALALSAAATARQNSDNHSGAVAAASRAVDLLRALVIQQPLAFTAQMVAALGSLGNVLNEPAEVHTSLASFDEALDLVRPLAAKSPDVFAPMLGRTQLLRGFRSMSSDDDDATIAALQASLVTFRGLSDDVAAGFVLEWSLAASILGLLLGDLDQPAAALVTLSEALEVLQRSPAGSGPLHEIVRGSVRLARGMLRAGIDDFEGADLDFAAGLPALRIASTANPQTRFLLAFTLSGLAWTAAEREDLVAMEAALREAILILRKCIADGEPHGSELASDLCLLAMIHQKRGKGGSARKLLLEAEVCFRSLPETELHALRDDFAGCLASLAELETDRRRKLLRLQEAVRLSLELFADEPSDPDDQLERLIGLTVGLAELRRSGEARATIQTAIARARELMPIHATDLQPVLADAQALLARLHTA